MPPTRFCATASSISSPDNQNTGFHSVPQSAGDANNDVASSVSQEQKPLRHVAYTPSFDCYLRRLEKALRHELSARPEIACANYMKRYLARRTLSKRSERFGEAHKQRILDDLRALDHERPFPILTAAILFCIQRAQSDVTDGHRKPFEAISLLDRATSIADALDRIVYAPLLDRRLSCILLLKTDEQFIEVRLGTLGIVLARTTKYDRYEAYSMICQGRLSRRLASLLHFNPHKRAARDQTALVSKHHTPVAPTGFRYETSDFASQLRLPGGSKPTLSDSSSTNAARSPGTILQTNPHSEMYHMLEDHGTVPDSALAQSSSFVAETNKTGEDAVPSRSFAAKASSHEAIAQSSGTMATKSATDEGCNDIEGSKERSSSPSEVSLDDAETPNTMPESANPLLRMEYNPLVQRLQQLQAELAEHDENSSCCCDSMSDIEEDKVTCDQTYLCDDTARREYMNALPVGRASPLSNISLTRNASVSPELEDTLVLSSSNTAQTRYTKDHEVRDADDLDRRHHAVRHWQQQNFEYAAERPHSDFGQAPASIKQRNPFVNDTLKRSCCSRGGSSQNSDSSLRNEGSSSGKPSSDRISSRHSGRGSPVYSEANQNGEHLKVASSTRQSEQTKRTVIPCPLQSDDFVCHGKDYCMSELARTLRGKKHNKQYCHPCKQIFPDGEAFKTHFCRNYCVVPKCLDAEQGQRHLQNRSTCVKAQEVRKQAEYEHLCSLLVVQPQELKEGVEQKHDGQRQCFNKRSLELAADAVQENLQLKVQLFETQQQRLMDLERKLEDERQRTKQLAKKCEELERENEESLLIVEHALDELKISNVPISRILRNRIRHHAPSVLDDCSEASRHESTTGVSPRRRVNTPSSCSDRSADLESSTASTTGDLSPQDGPAHKEYSLGKNATYERANPRQAALLSTDLSSDHDPSSEADQRNNGGEQRSHEGVRTSGQALSIRSQRKRRRMASSSENRMTTSFGEPLQVPSLAIGGTWIQGSSGTIPGIQSEDVSQTQAMGPPAFARTQQCSREQHQSCQMQHSHSSPKAENSVSAQGDQENSLDTGSGQPPPANTSWYQEVTLPPSSRGLPASHADYDFHASQDPPNAPLLQAFAVASNMQGFEAWNESHPITNDQVDNGMFCIDPAALFNLEPPGFPSTSSGVEPCWMEMFDA